MNFSFLSYLYKQFEQYQNIKRHEIFIYNKYFGQQQRIKNQFVILSGFCPEIKYSSHLMFVLSLSLERMQEPWIFHLLPTNNLEYFFPQLNKLFADFIIKLSFCHRVFKHCIYITFDCYHLDIHFISMTNENENGKYKL